MARTGVTVWLHGEGGTGKELAARFIHAHSSRRLGPFVSFNCSEFSPEERESGLFDPARDESGAQRSRPGAFELARGGTLYLDAFDVLPFSLQGKLLRLLDNGTFKPPGSELACTVDVRLIVASQADLSQMMAEGSFRQDLYYRIAEFPVRVPALRERIDDIPLIVESMLNQIGRETGQMCRVGQSAIDALCSHSFPGNMRELRSLLLGAVTRCKDGMIEAADIDFGMSAGGSRAARAKTAPRRRHAPAVDLKAPLVATGNEAETIRALLKQYGSRRAVAKKLGVTVPTLYRKLKQLGIINLGLMAVSLMAAAHFQQL